MVNPESFSKFKVNGCRLGFAGSTKDDMDQLRKDIDRLYPNLILSAVEVVLDRTAVLTRQSSIPLSPLTPEYPTNKGEAHFHLLFQEPRFSFPYM